MKTAKGGLLKLHILIFLEINKQTFFVDSLTDLESDTVR